MTKVKQLLVGSALLWAGQLWAQPAAPWVGSSFNGVPCNGGDQGFGPFDYTQRSAGNLHRQLEVVENYHFSPEVENLVRGKSSSIEGDLNYTLRAWPNHHRALLSIARYQIKIHKKLSSDHLETAPECYFQRALFFSSEDAATHALFAYYLKEMGRLNEADKYYQKALSLEPDNAKFEYTYGYLLIELKQYDKALEYAKRAYQHGSPPQGLKKKLEKLGVWKD